MTSLSRDKGGDKPYELNGPQDHTSSSQLESNPAATKSFSSRPNTETPLSHPPHPRIKTSLPTHLQTENCPLRSKQTPTQTGLKNAFGSWNPAVCLLERWRKQEDPPHHGFLSLSPLHSVRRTQEVQIMQSVMWRSPTSLQALFRGEAVVVHSKWKEEGGGAKCTPGVYTSSRAKVTQVDNSITKCDTTTLTCDYMWHTGW